MRTSHNKSSVETWIESRIDNRYARTRTRQPRCVFPFVVVGVQEGEWEINVTIGTIYGVNVTYLLGTNMVTQTYADTDLARPSSPAMDNCDCPRKICFVIILFNI